MFAKSGLGTAVTSTMYHTTIVEKHLKVVWVMFRLLHAKISSLI